MPPSHMIPVPLSQFWAQTKEQLIQFWKSLVWRLGIELTTSRTQTGRSSNLATAPVGLKVIGLIIWTVFIITEPKPMTKPTKWLRCREKSDQHRYPHSLISFCCALNELLRFLRVDSENWSDLADAQTDLSALGARVILLSLWYEKDPRKHGYDTIEKKESFILLFRLNVTLNYLSVISRRCLDVTGSSMVTLRVLPYWHITTQSHGVTFHPVTLYWHRRTDQLRCLNSERNRKCS